MKLKLMAPLALAIALLVGTAPVLADHERPRYRRTDGARRDVELEERARSISRRAHELYKRDRLSRDHLERTLAKLERVFDDVDRNGRVSNDRYHADMRVMAQIEDTPTEWS